MGFKVIYRGLEVVCDTFDDLDALAERAARHTNGSTPPAKINEKISVSASSLFTNGSGATVDHLVRALPESTFDVLSAMAGKPAVNDRDLRKELGLNSNGQISPH